MAIQFLDLIRPKRFFPNLKDYNFMPLELPWVIVCLLLSMFCFSKLKRFHLDSVFLRVNFLLKVSSGNYVIDSLDLLRQPCY